jgi:hypothetical protein
LGSAFVVPAAVVEAAVVKVEEAQSIEIQNSHEMGEGGEEEKGRQRS